jgi:hypothetical protein
LPAEANDGFTLDGCLSLARQSANRSVNIHNRDRACIVQELLEACDDRIPWNGCQPEPLLARIQPAGVIPGFQDLSNQYAVACSATIRRNRRAHFRHGLDSIAAARSQRRFQNRTDDARTGNNKQFAAGFLNREIRLPPEDSSGLDESSRSEPASCESPPLQFGLHVVRISIAHETHISEYFVKRRA